MSGGMQSRQSYRRFGSAKRREASGGYNMMRDIELHQDIHDAADDIDNLMDEGLSLEAAEKTLRTRLYEADAADEDVLAEMAEAAHCYRDL